MKKRALIIGTFLMLFLGLIYAWSLFAAPLEEAFNWSRSQTSITFSISIITFCLGSVTSGMILKKRPPGNIIMFSAILFLIGFYTASKITSIWGLYLSYGVICGFGVGLNYNAILATVPKWFPGKGGFVTGTLLMGMGLGSLVLGIVAKRIMDILLWPSTFRILAIVFFIVFIFGSFFIKNPEGNAKQETEVGKTKQYTLPEMLKTKDFWMIFIWSTIASSIGLGIVSNAAYMAIEIGVSDRLLPLMVGMVSVGNGMGRLISGAIADRLSGKKAMGISNLVFLIGLAIAILANSTGIVIFIAIGFVLGGVGYGTSPSLSAAITKIRFGEKHYPQNLSVLVLVLIPASLIGPIISANVYQVFGNYFWAYIAMFAIAILAFLPVNLYKEI